MKKIFMSLCALLVVFSVGCEKVENDTNKKGSYKEGTYLGKVEYDSYGTKYVTTAVVYVNEDGLIKSVFIDSTYAKNDVITTKKTLGNEYGMKETSANIGRIEGGAEWYEQVEKIEQKVIAEQGINWVKWSNEEKTELDVNTISSVTITADNYIKAIDNALQQAK